MDPSASPSVLFVYYTHTQQSLRVSEAMADVLRERGCDVSQAAVEFTDPHYARKFSVFPFRHAVRDLLTDDLHTWGIGRNYVRLEPGQSHLLRVEQ